MKKWILLLVVFAFVLVAVACGETETDTETPQPQPEDSADTEVPDDGDEIIELTLTWGPMEPETVAAWQKFYFDPFIEENPNVRINFNTIHGAGETVRIQVAAGAGPDIFEADVFEVPHFAGAGSIVPLCEFAEKWNWADTIFSWGLATATWDGRLWGIPHSYEVTGLYYNADMLREFGLEVPTTREEWLHASQVAMDNGLIALGYGFANDSLFQQWIFDHYLTAYAGADNIARLFRGELQFTDPEIAGAFYMLKEDWDAGIINNGLSGAITEEEGRALFLNEQAMFNPEGTWLSATVVPPGTWDFDWGFAPWPAFRDGNEPAGSIGVGATLMINAITEHLDVAAAFLNSFYAADPSWIAEGVAAGLEPLATPIDISLMPADTHADTLETLEAINRIAGLPNASYAPWTFYPARTNIWLQENLAMIWYDEMTVAEFLEAAQQVLDGELAEGFTFTSFE